MATTTTLTQADLERLLAALADAQDAHADYLADARDVGLGYDERCRWARRAEQERMRVRALEDQIGEVRLRLAIASNT